MIKTFRYRTVINKNEIHHTVYANELNLSVEKWMDRIDSCKDEVYSFNSDIVDSIKSQYLEGKLEIKISKDLIYFTFKNKDDFVITYIDEINKGYPHFVAWVTYLTTEEGGRKGFAYSGYRPHFKIEEKSSLTSAEQLLVDKDKVYPGETVISEIRLIRTETFHGLLYPGMKFQLCEAIRVIARGEIIEVINEELKRMN